MKFRTILLSNAGMIFIGSKVARYAKGKVFFRIKAVIESSIEMTLKEI